MTEYHSTVGIPLPDRSGQGGEILLIKSKDVGLQLLNSNEPLEIAKLLKETKIDLNKQLHPVAAPLIFVKLDQDGLEAVFALEKLNLKPEFWNLYQRLKPTAWLSNQRLSAENNVNINCEGESTQLGLALGLLLNGSNSPIRFVYATGKLSDELNNSYDKKVTPVASVPQKLDLIIAKHDAKKNINPTVIKNKNSFFPLQIFDRLFKRGKTDRISDGIVNQSLHEPIYCFTPLEYLKDGECLLVAELPQVQTLKEMGIEVRPIKSLREAAVILNAQHTRTRIQDILFLGGIGFISLFLIILGMFIKVHNTSIDVVNHSSKNYLKEFMYMCVPKEGGGSRFDLDHNGIIPVLPLFANENQDYDIVLDLQLEPKKSFLSDHYFAALVLLGEYFKPKVIAYPEPIAADTILHKLWQMKKQTVAIQDNYLVAVFNRNPIQENELEENLNSQFFKQGHTDIKKAHRYIVGHFPGYYSFHFYSAKKDPPCTELY
ncbi:MAG: hypothetical protein ABL903_18400 [Methylococcales bacterium]